MSRDFSIDVYRDEARYRVALAGELDIATAPALEAATSQAVAEGAKELLIDLAALDFADGIGVRAILRARALCWEHFCGFSVSDGHGQVERLLELTRVLVDLHRRMPRELSAHRT